MSQAAALAAVTGDYWSRLDAVQRAEQQLAAAELTLNRAEQAGDLWNDHTIAPLPARIDPEGRLR
jgi:hypothetical protein